MEQYYLQFLAVALLVSRFNWKWCQVLSTNIVLPVHNGLPVIRLCILVHSSCTIFSKLHFLPLYFVHVALLLFCISPCCALFIFLYFQCTCFSCCFSISNEHVSRVASLFPMNMFLVLHSFHVALFSCCNFLCWNCFVLHSFSVALSSCCTLSILHFFRITLFLFSPFLSLLMFFPCYTFFMFHFFRVLFLYGTFISYCTFSVLHSFHVLLFPCGTFFVLHSFHIALFSNCALFSC